MAGGVAVGRVERYRTFDEADEAFLAWTVERALRRGPGFTDIPGDGGVFLNVRRQKGVFRFRTHDEADRWWLKFEP